MTENNEVATLEVAMRVSGASMVQTSVHRRDSGSSLTRKQGDGVGSVLISNDPTNQRLPSITDFIDEEELRLVEQQVAEDVAQIPSQPMRASLESSHVAPIIKNSSSSALTTYNNLNFTGSQPKTTTNNVNVINPNNQLGTNLSYI